MIQYPVYVPTVEGETMAIETLVELPALTVSVMAVDAPPMEEPL